VSEHYHDVGDLRFLKEMGKLAPTEFKAWLGLDDIVRREDGAIPRKFRELIALGVASRGT
jgi:alkylhydroperoxidase/carboxymuconolactone decarboxylase family protein YurZ